MNPDERIAVASAAAKVGVVLRAATDDEKERMVAQWLRSLRPPAAPEGPFGPMLKSPTPGHAIAPSCWRFAAETMVRSQVDGATVMAADLLSVPGEPVGWVAFDPPAQHGDTGRLYWVHVIGPARRKGIARVLLAAAGNPSMATYMTPEGYALLSRVAQECVAETPTAFSGPTSEDDACRTIGGNNPAA